MSLLFSAFGINKPHAGLPCHRCNDEGIVGIILGRPFDERLYVNRRDQTDVMVQRPSQSPPMMTRSAGLHGDTTSGVSGKELFEIRTRTAPVEDNFTFASCRANLETVLGKIDGQGADLRHGSFFSADNIGALSHLTMLSGWESIHTITVQVSLTPNWGYTTPRELGQ